MIGTKYIIYDLETSGLCPWYGDRVTCICAVDSDGRRFEEYAENFLPDEGLQDKIELELIRKFVDWLGFHRVEDTLMVGHNSKCFDAGFLLARPFVIKKGGDPFKDKQGEGPDALTVSLYMPFDTMEKAKKLFNQRFISLNNLAAKLGLSCSKCGNGLQAIQDWKDKKYDELIEYCRQDVEVTRQVFLKLRERL